MGTTYVVIKNKMLYLTRKKKVLRSVEVDDNEINPRKVPETSNLICSILSASLVKGGVIKGVARGARASDAKF